MRKIIAFFLSVAIVFGIISVNTFASEYYDVPGDAYYADAIRNLSIYGIVSGYNGYFNPDAFITRAEFAKIAAITGGLEKEAAGKSGSKKFNDVNIGYWANGYINSVSDNSIIVGYPNGLYMPDNNITYQEAATVILRLLDYTSEHLGDNWPYAYMEKAKSLGLMDGIEKSGADYITRGDMCVMINRALVIELNGKKDDLITKMNITTSDEVLVIATKNEDQSLDYNQIKTSGGTYRLAKNDAKVLPFTKVKLVLNSDGEIINAVTTYVPEIKSTTIDTITSEAVYFSDGTNSKSLSVKDSTLCYKDGVISGFGSIKNTLEEGAAVSFAYERDGTLGYILIKEVEYNGPIVVRDNVDDVISALGAASDAIYVKDGMASDKTKIEEYDVCYYQSDIKTVYVYSKKISGVYEEAFPSKANVSSVEISGLTYDIETQTAAYKLGAKSGSYDYNSRVTVLLGRNGGIVDVVDLSSSSASLYGVLLSCTTEIEEEGTEKGSQISYINVLNGEGNEVSYKTKNNYSNKIGCVGKISFDDNGYAIFGQLADRYISGEVDLVNNKIGTNWLSSNCKIIELTYIPETNTGVAKAQVIELSAIGKELKKAQTVYAVESGSFGDITALFVKDITGGGYEYGIVQSSSMSETKNDISGTYKVFTSDGTSKTYRMNSYLPLSSGAGVKMVLNGSSLEAISMLTAVRTSTKCTALDHSRIKLGTTTYSVGTNAMIVLQSGTNYRRLSVEDAQAYIGKTARAYTDSKTVTNAVIRLIVFSE